MRLLASLLLLAFFQAPATPTVPDPHTFLYTRAVSIPSGDTPRTCTPLDAATYVHAQPALSDLRLFSGHTEIPYALTLSETSPTAASAKVLNLGVRGHHIVFDLAMPPRPYTHVDLDLNGENFLASARVTGLRSPGQPSGTSLGAFTLFDLARQDLGRTTTLPLSESDFPFLHVDLEFLDPGHTFGVLGPDMVRGARVPASREAETLYTTVLETTNIVPRGRESVATFHVPAHLPIERVSFVIGTDGPPNFSRDVSLRAKADGDANAMREEVTGQITRVKLTEAGHPIHFESLALPAVLGSNAQNGALLEVAVDNGDDQPLAIRAVRLDMRERKLCFDAPDAPVDLLYGNPTLAAPVYDYSRLFSPTAPARSAQIRLEYPNPLYQPPAIKPRSLTERHPALLWIALLAVAAILGTIAFVSSRRL